MTTPQYLDLSERERTLCHYRLLHLDEFIQDQDYWKLKKDCLKIDWGMEGRKRRKEIIKLLKQNGVTTDTKNS
jgi:hypothetical protein